MSRLEFSFVYLVIAALFTLVGLAAVVLPPRRYQEIFGRLWPISSTGSRSNSLQRRMAGLVIAVMGAVGIKAAIVALRGPRVGQQPGSSPGYAPQAISGWFPLGVGLAVCLGGLYLLIFPGQLVTWSQHKLFSGRVISERTLRIWGLAIRVTGALMIYASVDLFSLGLK